MGVIIAIVVVAVLGLGVVGCTAAVLMIGATVTPPSTAGEAQAPPTTEPPLPETSLPPEEPLATGPETEPTAGEREDTEAEPEETDATDEVPRGKVGTTAKLPVPSDPDGEITVTKVTVATKEPGEFGSKPDRGLYVVVHMRVRGVGDPFDFNPLEFYVRGRDGSHHNFPTYSDAWGPALNAVTLRKGEQTSGTIVFDADRSARHGQIVYAPDVFGDSDPRYEWDY